MNYLEDFLRELICYELDIPNVRQPIASDDRHNDFYVENEKKIKEAMKGIAEQLFHQWKLTLPVEYEEYKKAFEGMEDRPSWLLELLQSRRDNA